MSITQADRDLANYRRFQMALHAAQACVFEVDIPNQRYTFFENAETIYQKPGPQIMAELEQFSALPPEEYQTGVSEYFSHPGDYAAIDKAFACIYRGQPTSYIARMRAGDTEFIWCKVDAFPVMEDGVPVRMIGVVTNLDSLVRTAEQYREYAEMDALTGLYNRRGFQHRLSELLARVDRGASTLLFADLDNLKQINDRGGHLAGDRALLELAQTLRRVFPQPALLARWGGDEFLVLLPQAMEEDALAALVRPLLGGGPGDPSCSLGAALLPADAADADAALSQADAALYEAKHCKPAFRFYRPDVGQHGLD